jgi:hypothetical protein
VSRRGYCARRSRVTDGGTIRFAEQHAARLGVHCTTRRGLGAGPSRVLRRASTRAPRRALGTRAGSVAGFLSHQQRGSRSQLRAQSGLDTRRHLRLWYVPRIDTCHIVLTTQQTCITAMAQRTLWPPISASKITCSSFLRTVRRFIRTLVSLRQRKISSMFRSRTAQRVHNSARPSSEYSIWRVKLQLIVADRVVQRKDFDNNRRVQARADRAVSGL